MRVIHMGKLVYLDNMGCSYRDLVVLELQNTFEALQDAADILRRQKGIGSELLADKLERKANELNDKMAKIQTLK